MIDYLLILASDETDKKAKGKEADSTGTRIA